MSVPSNLPTVARSVMPTSGDRKYGELSDALRQKSLDIFMQAVAEIEKILAHDAEATLPTKVPGMSVAAISA